MVNVNDGTALPLAAITALEHSTGLAGAYAGRLLADAGARVVRAGGASGLGRGDAFDRYLHHGKEQLSGGEEELPPIAARLRADIVILEADAAPDKETLRRFGDAAVVVITPWGLGGPWSDTVRPWSELTVQAEAGGPLSRGLPDSYPIITGSSESLWVAGTIAAGAAVTALQGGVDGRLVDVPLLDVTAYSTTMFQSVMSQVSPQILAQPPRRDRLSPGVEPASDGWVGFNLASTQNHEDFLVMIERPDYLADEQMRSFVGRYERRDEWTRAVRDWTTRHTVAEIVETASQFRIPCAPVHDDVSVLEDPQVVARDFYPVHPAGDFRAPAVPFLFDGRRPDRHDAPTDREPAPPSGGARDGSPFEGLRVVDLGTYWVGAYVGSALGAFGADVVKVESVNRMDGSRALTSVATSEPSWWEKSYFYLGVNFDKRNVTLDLNEPEGRDLLVRLIAQADVLIENYAPRVLERLGLDWEAVHELNPRLVMLRMPAFGLTGPRRSLVGFAQTVEQFSGLCWRTGYPGGDPTNPSGPADPMGGANAFFALSSALLRARATGEGALVEAALAESAMVMSSEQVIRRSAGQAPLGRIGNRSELAELQGIFEASDPETWVGLTVAGQRAWETFVRLDGLEALASDSALSTAEGRREQTEAIEIAVAAWIATWKAEELVAVLLDAGIPAAVVSDPRLMHEHPQLAARGSYGRIEHPQLGEMFVPTLPFRIVGRPSWVDRPPPALGQHNEEILGGELGLSAGELEDLERRRIIGSEP